MSKAVISIAVILVVVLAGAGVWWSGLIDPWFTDMGFIAEEQQEAEEQAQTQQSELSTGGDASDEALDQDLNTLDAQLDVYNESSSELDASLSDEPVKQDPNF